jgi:hypothetical protein
MSNTGDNAKVDLVTRKGNSSEIHKHTACNFLFIVAGGGCGQRINLCDTMNSTIEAANPSPLPSMTIAILLPHF